MRRLTLTAAFFIAVSAGAQTIGTYTLIGDGFEAASPSTPYTIIDLSAHATRSGQIGVVAFRTFSNECSNAVKVKFFRQSGDNLTLIAERGPFSVTQSLTKVTLSPPVDVAEGDFIGLAAVGSCVRLIGQRSSSGVGAYQYAGDVTGTVTVSGGKFLYSFLLGAYGAAPGTTEVRTQIIPAAASAPGVGGTSFKTEIVLANPRNNAVAGRLVYHPEATSGTASDPSVPFNVTQARSQTFPDFVGGLGITGKGSVDVYTTLGFEAPYATARVFEESGGSTKGFTFDALPPNRALQPFEQGVLFGPSDPVKFRMNLGIRTLDTPVKLQWGIYNNGVLRSANIQRDYPANYYEQIAATVLFGMPLQPGDFILAYSTQGAAFVYGSIIDNASADPSVQLAGQVK